MLTFTSGFLTHSDHQKIQVFVLISKKTKNAFSVLGILMTLTTVKSKLVVKNLRAILGRNTMEKWFQENLSRKNATIT